MAEQIQIKTEDHNPTLEEQAAAQEAAANSNEGGEEKKILGKFSSYEELERSYTELERKLGQSTQSKPDDAAQTTAGETEGDTGETPGEDEARQTVEDAGLDFDALTNSFHENGGLTDEDYSKLEGAGIPRDVVDQFIAGQQAQAALMESKVFETVGGADRYTEMTDWAGNNLTDEEVEIYNREVNSGDEKRIMFAVKSLKAQYERAVGFEPSRQITGKAGSAETSAYASWAQVQADMSDPRYSADPAFRAQVEAKLARSKVLQ